MGARRQNSLSTSRVYILQPGHMGTNAPRRRQDRTVPCSSLHAAIPRAREYVRDQLRAMVRALLRALLLCQPLALTSVGPGTRCAGRTRQLLQQGAAAAQALVDGDPVAAWRALPQLQPVDRDGCEVEEQARAELHNLVAAAAMRVAALALPPPELSAESMTTLAADALSKSLQLRPAATETNWNAALLAGMAEGATGTWEVRLTSTCSLPLIFSYKSEKSLCGTGDAATGWTPSPAQRGARQHLREQSRAVCARRWARQAGKLPRTPAAPVCSSSRCESPTGAFRFASHFAIVI